MSYYIYLEEMKRRILLQLKIKEDWALLLLLIDAVKNNVSDMESKKSMFFPEP